MIKTKLKDSDIKNLIGWVEKNKGNANTVFVNNYIIQFINTYLGIGGNEGNFSGIEFKLK